MAIELLSVAFKTPTRVRVEFTEQLASGAFSAAWFHVDSTDSASPYITIRAVYAVPGQPGVAELVLDTAMVEGGAYSVAVTSGIPSSTSTLATNATESFVAPGLRVSRTRGSLMQFDIFGVDALWNGADIVEGADEDVESIAGRPNAEQAVKRRLVSEGLMWDMSYGVQGTEHIDAPTIGSVAIQGRVRQQMTLDNRVSSSKVTTISADTVQVIYSLFGDNDSVSAEVTTRG